MQVGHVLAPWHICLQNLVSLASCISTRFWNLILWNFDTCKQAMRLIFSLNEKSEKRDTGEVGHFQIIRSPNQRGGVEYSVRSVYALVKWNIYFWWMCWNIFIGLSTRTLSRHYQHFYSMQLYYFGGLNRLVALMFPDKEIFNGGFGIMG